jgi:hypothetical protein
MKLVAAVSFALVKNQKHETEKKKHPELAPFDTCCSSHFGIGMHETGIDA